MGTFATYSDVGDFAVNASGGIEIASLIGGNSSLVVPVSAGATNLTVGSVTGFPAAGAFPLWIFDGINSERIVATVAGSSLSVPGGVAVAHAAGVNVASAGGSGCLADSIVRASRMLENYCRQGPDGASERSLYSLARTEVLRGPSARAAWDEDQVLVLHPHRFPVQAVQGLTVQFGALAGIALSLPLLTLPVEGRTIEIPFMQSLPVAPNAGNSAVLREGWFAVTLNYTAGPCVNGVPDDIRLACQLFTADLLVQRRNPTGAVEMQLGKAHYIYRLRGDGWTSSLREQACTLLTPYVSD